MDNFIAREHDGIDYGEYLVIWNAILTTDELKFNCLLLNPSVAAIFNHLHRRTLHGSYSNSLH